MPKRYSFRNVAGKWTRKARKNAFIERKNNIKAGNGIYFTRHLEDGKAVWIDFCFLSEKYKGKYFSVAARTVEYAEHNNDEDAAFEYMDKFEPLNEEDKFPGKIIKISKKKSSDTNTYMYQSVASPAREKYYARLDEVAAELNKKPRKARPHINVHRDYGPVAYGLHVTINSAYLDEKTIIEFVKMFRELGEPITRGIVWQGDEVEITPAKISNRLRIGEPIKSA